MGVWTLACFCCKPGSVVWGLRPNINSFGDGTWSSSGVVRYIHRAVYGHSSSSSAFLRFQLIFLPGYLLDVDMGKCSADAALFTFCFEHFTDVLRSEVGNDSGW